MVSFTALSALAALTLSFLNALPATAAITGIVAPSSVTQGYYFNLTVLTAATPIINLTTEYFLLVGVSSDSSQPPFGSIVAQLDLVTPHHFISKNGSFDVPIRFPTGVYPFASNQSVLTAAVFNTVGVTNYTVGVTYFDTTLAILPEY